MSPTTEGRAQGIFGQPQALEQRQGRQGGYGTPLLASPCQSPAPLLSWFPGWDNLSPILHTQAETPAHNKTPRTMGIELWQSSGVPVPNLGTSFLREQSPMEVPWDADPAS